MEPVESIDLVSNQEDDIDNLAESVNGWSRTLNEVGATFNFATGLVNSLRLRIGELEQINSQHENDKARLNNEIINLQTKVQGKDATINELHKQIATLAPGIQRVAGPRQQEVVGGSSIVPPQIVNAVQGAGRKERGNVSNLENGNRLLRTRRGMKQPIPKKIRGQKHVSVPATTRQGKHQQRDVAVPKKRISQQPATSVFEGRMGLPSQNLASNVEAVGGRGEDSGNPPHYVDPQSHRYYRKCVCGKRFKTYKAIYAHMRIYDIHEKNRVSAS